MPPFQNSRSTAPLNITLATGLLILINLGIHIVRQTLNADLDTSLLVHFGFVPSLFMSESGDFILAGGVLKYLTPISYQFLHSDFTHLLMNMAFLLALGTPIERRIGPGRLVLFLLSMGALSTLATMLVFHFKPVPMLLVGASGAVSAAFGAIVHFGFQGRQIQVNNAIIRTLGFGRTLLLVFILINTVFGLLGIDSFGGVRTIAWEVHVAGIILGYVLFPLFDTNNPQPPDFQRKFHVVD